MTDSQLFTTAITPAGVEHLHAVIEKTGGLQVSDPNEKHTFTVTVSGCTAEQAVQVMCERIDIEEDYGFPYAIEFTSPQPARFVVTDTEHYTAVELPDGNLRIFEPTEESDDASRMYVLDVLGIDVLVRWSDATKGENANTEWTAEDGSPHRLHVIADSDCDSIRPFTGELVVGNGMDDQEWGVVEADEVESA